jgi:hypothetical protein
MSTFRDFVFNRDRSTTYDLAVAMTGVRLGERQVMVGDDAPLFAQLAAKAGLTGGCVVVVGSGKAAAQVEAAAVSAGVLLEVRQGALPVLPVGDDEADVAVVHVGPTLLALTAAERAELARALHRALRIGGRVEVVEGQPSSLLTLFRTPPAGLQAFRAEGGASRLLEAAGFHPVRVLADRDGQRFTEGLKTA